MIKEQLEQFIAIPTIASDQTANQLGIDFVRGILTTAGFEVHTVGESPYHQPVVKARYSNPGSSQKVVLYGHYDVEKIKTWEEWDTPPFQLVEKNGRYYCRGIADNKGVLLMRLVAIQEMLESGEEVPNILWIIQGEEEVGGQTPFEVIPDLIAGFGAKIYVEETGIHKNGKPVIFYLTKGKHLETLNTLNAMLYGGEALIENRSLNKFSPCPFLKNIPKDGHYIGFGPNDMSSNIHRANESLDMQLLVGHKEVFKQFIRWLNATQLA